MELREQVFDLLYQHLFWVENQEVEVPLSELEKMHDKADLMTDLVMAQLAQEGAPAAEENTTGAP